MGFGGINFPQIIILRHSTPILSGRESAAEADAYEYMDFEQSVQLLCNQTLKIITKNNIRFRAMKRKNNRVNTKRGFVIGRTNLKTGLITIDILTPKKRQPKAIASILRTLCHEVAHYQKRPFKQYFKGRRITRQHYPGFYRQVNKNIERLKKDKELGKYF